MEYVGSSNNLRKRLLDHLSGRSHSERLRNRLLSEDFSLRFTVTSNYQPLESLLLHSYERERGTIPPLNQLKTGSAEWPPPPRSDRPLMNDAETLTILFVDDAPVTCSVYQQQLERAGYRVVVAESARQAVRMARLHRPQLAIIDYYMPDQNGDLLTRELLQDPQTSELLVVIHSQYPDALERCLEAGAVDFIYKEEPIDIFLLRIRSLRKYLDVRRQNHQREVEQERQEREYVENILATLRDGLIITDVEGNIDLCNPAACALLGWEQEALQGRRVVELVEPPATLSIQGRDEEQQRLQSLYERDPQRFWELLEYTLLPLVALQIEEGALLWSSPRAKQLLLQQPLGEHAVVQKTRLQCQEGAVWLQWLADPQQEDRRELLRLAPLGGIIEQEYRGEERQVVDRHGSLIPVFWSGAILRNHKFGIRGALFSLHDLHPEKAREQQQLHQQREHQHASRMASIGTLAGGIAHEFNNMLQPIMGFSALLLEQEELHQRLPTRDRERLQLIHQGANRGSELVNQILDFSRKDEPLPDQELSITALLQMALKMVQATLPASISLRQRVAPGLGKVMMNSTAFHQLLLNLCSNAADAIEEAGVTEGEIEISAISDLEKGQCRIIVSDNGDGVDESIRQQIFDPFFTTRAVGKGAGMGLSVVLGIVERSGGTIEVEKRDGEGSRFVLTLPVVKTGVKT